ncbi:hypothetical protein ANN_18174 [Periplaneta americana]|uniref:Uncharacterized protein n=1 Tax=Periplaneta americana TaxID=6978 RepID=A0ABQ8SNL2_PERAM|nr:hypothetical protein ANN_18174 [Periplaneta americana]
MGNACYYSVEQLLSSSLLSKNLKVRIYKTVILPVLLYGCETWTLTLREELRLRVFENKVLRKIFGAKRDEVTGEWRKLHNTELHALYSSPDIIRNIKSRRLRWAGHVARMGESRNAYRVLRVFENKVLRKIFEAKENEVTGVWRKLHKAELHALCSSPDIIRNIKSICLRWAGHVALMGESRNPYRVLVGRPEGKRSLGRSRRRWEDNIKMDLREMGYDDRDWINLAQDRDQWRAYANGNEPPGSLNAIYWAPSDYHIFMHMKTWLDSKRFDDDEELKTSVVGWLQSQAAKFYDCGISKLVKRYKCLNVTSFTGKWKKHHFVRRTGNLEFEEILKRKLVGKLKGLMQLFEFLPFVFPNYNQVPVKMFGSQTTHKFSTSVQSTKANQFCHHWDYGGNQYAHTLWDFSSRGQDRSSLEMSKDGLETRDRAQQRRKRHKSPFPPPLAGLLS